MAVTIGKRTKTRMICFPCAKPMRRKTHDATYTCFTTPCHYCGKEQICLPDRHYHINIEKGPKVNEQSTADSLK